MITVPWNASWTGEDQFEIRPCRWAQGKLAMWQPHRPGHGRPIFAKPHFVRQRMSIIKMLCTVCGKHTPKTDRWWFEHGHHHEGWFMTTESPVHFACAEHAMKVCPNLKANEAVPRRFPDGHYVLMSLVGGDDFEQTYGVRVAGRTIVGALKIAWPSNKIRMKEAA